MAYSLALAATWLVFLLVLLYYVNSKVASVFNPMSFFLFYHFILFVLKPTLSYSLNYRYIYGVYHFIPSLSDKLIVLGAVNLSLISFTFACLTFGSVPYSDLEKRPRNYQARREYMRPLFVTWLMVGPLACYSLYKVIGWSTSGTFDMVFDQDAGTFINTSGNGYIVEAQIMLVPLVVFTAWIFRFTLISLIPAATFIIAKSFTGQRWPIVVTIFALMLLYFYDARVRWLKYKFLVPICFFWLAFNVMSEDRGGYLRQLVGIGNYNGVNADRVAYKSNLGFLESMDYGNLEFFELIVYAVPQRTKSYDYFAEQLQVITEPIPRVIWKNKPKGAPIKFFRLDDYIPVFSFTKSVAGAGWFGLGWLGVAIWSWIFGAAYGIAYKKWARSTGVILTVSYIIVLALALQFLRDGILVSVVKMGGFTLLPLLFIRFIKSRVHFRSNERSIDLAYGADEALAALPPAVQRRRAILRQDGGQS